MITPRYRSDYVGEFVVLETKWSGGKKNQNREWVPASIENKHISRRAAAIISDIDRYQFDYTRLHRHRGGLLSSKKMQTYVNSDIGSHCQSDFTIETDYSKLDRLLEQNYTDNNIVYTTPKYCLEHPGTCHIIPYFLRISVPALLLYMAAFDEHKEIFMLGYTKETSGQDPAWIIDVCRVLQAYKEVKFYCVCNAHMVPDSFLKYPNLSKMTYRDWISYCDV